MARTNVVTVHARPTEQEVKEQTREKEGARKSWALTICRGLKKFHLLVQRTRKIDD
jgi:hypothetical protein